MIVGFLSKTMASFGCLKREGHELHGWIVSYEGLRRNFLGFTRTDRVEQQGLSAHRGREVRPLAKRNPASPHYKDPNAPWLNGDVFPLPLSRARIEAETELSTLLLPVP